MSAGADTSGEWSTRPHAKAFCMTCGWSCHAANAHGVGVQHARRKKHNVRIEVYVVRVYNHESE